MALWQCMLWGSGPTRPGNMDRGIAIAGTTPYTCVVVRHVVLTTNWMSMPCGNRDSCSRATDSCGV